MAFGMSARLRLVAGAAGPLLILPALSAVSAGPAGEEAPASVAAARENAKLIHDIYASTLEAMHHHFFRNNRAVLPARALEDVIDDMESKSTSMASSPLYRASLNKAMTRPMCTRMEPLAPPARHGMSAANSIRRRPTASMA